MKSIKSILALVMSITFWCNYSVQAQTTFHSQAKISETDKISILLQQFNRAFNNQDMHEIKRCLAFDNRNDSKRLESIMSRISDIYNRLDRLSDSLFDTERLDNDISLIQSLHITEAENAIITSDNVSIWVEVSLGYNPQNCGTKVNIQFDGWLSRYGIRNILEVCNAIDNSIDLFKVNPNTRMIQKINDIRSKNTKSAADLSNFLVNETFYSDLDKSIVIDVFTRGQAKTTFNGKSIFDKPYDILETIVYDDNLGDGWGMVSSDPNWNRFIAFCNRNYSSEPVIFARNYHQGPPFNTDNVPFQFPTGVSLLTDQDLFVCDAHNNQVGVYWVNISGNELIDMEAFGDRLYGEFPLNFPIDVDAGHLTMYPSCLFTSNRWCCAYRDWVAICDQGNNRVVLGTRDEGFVCDIGRNTPDHYLNMPTSVIFGRDIQTGWQNFDVYVVDNGNKRIVRYSCDNCCDFPPDYDGFIESDAGIFESNSYLSSIDVDGFGQLYVLDSHNGYIYKFQPDLTYIGKWGGPGTDLNHLYYPSRLAITRGWHYEYAESCLDDILIPSRMGNLLVTDFFTDSTGIKRYRFNNDISDFNVVYEQRDCSIDTLAGDLFHVTWEQIDWGTVEIDFAIAGYGLAEEYSGLVGPGSQWRGFAVPYDAPVMCNYGFAIKLYSPYGGGLIHEEYSTGVYDRGECNFPPTIDSMYIVDNDTCFMTNNLDPYLCAVDAHDRDHPTEELTYTWLTTWCVDTIVTHTQVGLFVDPDSCDYWTDPYNCCRESVTTSQNRIYLNPEPVNNPPECPNWPGIKNTGAFPDKADDYKIFTVIVTDPEGGWTKRSFSMPLGLGDNSCDSIPPIPSGCPILYYENDGQWRLVNNLIAESGALNSSGEYVTEIYPVNDISTNKAGGIHLRITEETDEVTYLKLIRGAIIEYPETLNLIHTNRNRQYVLSEKYSIPAIAYTSYGDTITDLINKEDGIYFDDQGPGQVFVEYDLRLLYGDTKNTLDDIPGGPGIPPPDKGHAKRSVTADSRRTGYYELWAYTRNGSWVSVAKVYPRLIQIPQYIEMSDFIIGDHLVMRIDYNDQVKFDYIPFQFFNDFNFSANILRLTAATHNQDGDVLNLLANENSPNTVLSNGEYIDLEFMGQPPKRGYKQLLLLTTCGRYEETGISPKVNKEFSFEQNYPNPFNPNTSFQFYLPIAGYVTLKVYNVLGQTIKILVDGPLEAGNHTVSWNSRNDLGDAVASGIYFVRLSAGDYSATRKVEVLK